MPTRAYIYCCLPNSTCQGWLFANGGYPRCENAGGVAFQIAVNTPDPIPESEVCGWGIGITNIDCTQQAPCVYALGGECEITNYALCINFFHGSWNSGLSECPFVTETMMKLFPVRTRTFPYHLEFGAAYSGFNPLPPPGQGPEFHRKRYWRQSRSSIYSDHEQRESMGRPYLYRRNMCLHAQTNVRLAKYDEAECVQAGGIWRWDGVPYLIPAHNLITVPESDSEACGKCSKLLMAMGFWFPDRATTGSGCYRADNYAPLSQHTNQTNCINAGGIWRPAGFIKPPYWSGALRLNNYGSGGVDREPGTYHGREVEDYPGAAEYQYLIYTPVHSCSAVPTAPYCPANPQAPQQFPFRETFTYEIACTYRNHINELGQFVSGEPYRNRAWGDSGRKAVPEGILGVIAYSSGDPQRAPLAAYCGDAPQGNCPQVGIDCIDEWRCIDAFENVIRKNYIGVTKPTRFTWDADPQGRGWWVEYTTELRGWFTQDAYWMALAAPTMPNRPARARWAAWYQGVVICRWPDHADPNDPAFKSWILTHDSGFGIDFEPRYRACNDALLMYGDQPNALADTVYPPANVQPLCDELRVHYPTAQIPPPCLRLRGELSHWYMGPLGGPIPEDNLYHETTRKRYTNPGKTAYVSEFGWANLSFRTNTPHFIIEGE